MAVAASLHRGARRRLAGEIVRHDRRGAAQKRERVRRHPPVALGQKLGNAARVTFREDGDGVPIERPVQIGVKLARSARPKRLALLQSFRAARHPIAHQR